MKSKFSDENKIDFNKVDWEEVFVDLNEKEIIKEVEDCEEITEELYNKILDGFDIDIIAEDTKETILEKLLKGKIDFSNIERELKDKSDFQAGLMTIEGYDGPNGYTVKYKSKVIFSEKKGLLLDKLNYNKEVAELAKLVSDIFKVKINFKEYDDLDKKWLAIWK